MPVSAWFMNVQVGHAQPLATGAAADAGAGTPRNIICVPHSIQFKFPILFSILHTGQVIIVLKPVSIRLSLFSVLVCANRLRTNPLIEA